MKKLFIYSILLITIFSSCLDPCRKTNCINGGYCNNGTCECPFGYEGTNCETEMREKFIGIFNGSYSDSDGDTYKDKIIISARASVTELKIPLYKSFLIGTISNGNNFVIKNQSVETGISTEGKGSIKGNKIIINLTIYEKGFPTFFLDFEGIKQ